MATKEIPARTEVTCDACRVLCHEKFGPGQRKRDTKLILRRHILDMLGDPAADGTIEFDFCDACASIIEAAINQAVEEIRQKRGG